MASNTILTSMVTGGSNNHTTVVAEANAIATDFITQGVVGTITLNTGSGGTGSFCVNADASPDMGVTIKAGQAYISATPSSQDAQVLRARAAADYTAYTINANASGSTKYDWIYLSVDATKANNPAADASDVTSIVTSRSSSNSTDNGSPPTYGLLLAIVTVANGASSITNSNITDSRVNAIFNSSQLGTTTGWTLTTNQWTYSSYDSTNKTGVITVPSDATTRYSAGMRVKFSNNGSTQYGIITKVASTAITVYFGTDYSLTNSAITSTYYSSQKAPFGFPLDPAKWTVTTTSTSTDTTSSPGSTWTNPNSNSITLPIGSWRVKYQASLIGVSTAAQTQLVAYATLSTANNSESDTGFSTHGTLFGASGSLRLGIAVNQSKDVTVSSATPYYLNTKYGPNTGSSVGFEGSVSPTVITAICNYL